MSESIGLYDLTHEELVDLLRSWGEPTYRADQIWRWLYKAWAADYAKMHNLPKTLRDRLEADTNLNTLLPVEEQVSTSGQTRKLLSRLTDGHTIETVLMHYDDRRTACISSQAGCGIGCVFCATGQAGLVRNLSTGEIVSQVVLLARTVSMKQVESGLDLEQTHPITNVVFMGMGEPLANYDAVWQAIETLVDPRASNLGARRITVSTVGLVPGIRRLTREALPVNLAVSLHAANDLLRNNLVPVNRTYPIADLMTAVRDYVAATNRRVTIEYALIAKVNDTLQQARQLGNLLQGLLCHVNLIPLNPTSGSPFEPPSRNRVTAFRNQLESLGVPVTIRVRRGIDIQAGCGQLRQAHADRTLE